ncbi:GMC family oxidoreductase [Roseibium marinum]|uniref:Choline dehydrogenase n=1 Tax=Roseibium marinum TaxID=281252 RepID=A0A2S3UT20_9HYPH|nr:GMC family oxidoreductase N-terminal domain-containing protein [Roseibium marinum]POF30836.1 choline dehydrogenase [Roseibium marinum]
MPAAVSSIPRKSLVKAYDYIVVGSGSGGCPVVHRLIEDTDATVLLIEAGEPGIGVPGIDDPAEWVALGKSRYDWGYDYAPAPHADNRVIGIPRGRVLGGSSAINALMWYRGHPLDYDAWDDAGATGWRFDDVLPYFKRCEDWEGGETAFRGAGGPLTITTSRDLHPVARALMEGAGELGMPVIGDPNGANNEGAAPSNFNISGGKRWSSATGYLFPILDSPHLTVLTGSLTIGLVIEKGRCIGVRHLVDGDIVETRATGEVILAAGAIDTPRLLMLSGIGKANDLKALGIPPVLDLPGVGRNLQDHPLIQACVFRASRPLGAKTDNGGGTMLNWKSRPDLEQPDVHAFPVQGNSAEPALRETYDMSGEVFAIGFGLMRSKSTGYMKMLTNDPRGPLELQPNYLAEASDMEALVSAYHTIASLAGTKAFRDLSAGLLAPDRPLEGSDLKAFIRQGCSTFFHTCGTARMGTDDLAVTDPRLKVRGIEGLRISDASVIPIIPTCNTHAPVTMIGERAADFLKEDA